MPPVPKKTRPLRAIGLTCGIGSMLVGARQAGFEIVGNIEWRKYYHHDGGSGRNTFLENFPGALFPNHVDELSSTQLDSFVGADIALGHPECGNFSNLNNRKDVYVNDPCDIPLYVDLVAKLRPKFFVMDDLPKSFIAFSMDEYYRRLPDYDLFPEWISNYHYGNVQKHRKRMFMIGALKSERWAFVPGEDPEMSITLKDVIGDLCDEDGWPASDIPNCESHVLNARTGRATHLLERDRRSTWRELKEWFMNKPNGEILEYHGSDGSVKHRFGLCKTHWDGPCHVLTGTNPVMHPLTSLPLNIRERARIQGFPDDFVFHGTILEDDGTWNHDRNTHLIKQTGKAMPVQFCRYVSRQVMAHLTGTKFESSGRRMLTPNAFVDSAKKKYCTDIGYSDQEKACAACWLARSCSIRRDKYGIGLPVVDVTPKESSRIRRERPRPVRKERQEVEIYVPERTIRIGV